jgi:ribonuclease P protein component
MIPKGKRVSAKTVTELFQSGKRADFSAFSVRFQLGSQTQIACIAPKTVAKSAVSRNSLRRKWYASLAQVKVPKGTFIFILKKSALELSPLGREQALSSFFDRIS